MSVCTVRNAEIVTEQNFGGHGIVSKMRTAEGSGWREAFSWYAVLLRGLLENDNRALHCGAGRLHTS